MFHFDILMGDIIDQDALTSRVKRSASFYGTNALIHRFSIIFFITSVFFTFQYTAWEKIFTPVTGWETVIGLKLILSLFPAIACFLALVFMKFYKLHGETLKK
jgi:Na+/melibiose symporter-like transporter